MRTIFALLIMLSAVWADPRVTVSVDRNRIYEGDSITLIVKVEGGSEVPSVDLTDIKTDFNVASGPNQSTNYQWINGAMKSEISLSWMLVPRKKGELKIPELNINLNGKQYRTSPIEISVFERDDTEAALQTGSDMPEQDFFLEATVDNLQPHRGEQVTLTYTLFTNVDLSGWDVQKQPLYKGFWTQDLYSPKSLQLREVRRGGKKMYAATVQRKALFPTHSGRIQIEPMTAMVSVKVRGSSRNWFADPFFSRSKSYTIASNSLDLDVQQLPANPQGKITAAVGNWKLTSKVSKQKLQQDEAVTLTIQINGQGNLRAISVEDIVFPPELEVFEPEISVEEQPLRDLIAGTKTISYVLIPRDARRITLPSVKLTYFDPRDDRWRTKSTQPITLDVTPSDKISSSAPGLTKEEIRLMGEDIRFADQNPPQWRRMDEQLVSGGMVGLVLGSVFFFILPLMVNLGQNHFLSTAGKRQARKALPQALELLQSGDSASATYANIQAALNRFLDLKSNQNAVRSAGEIVEQLTIHLKSHEELHIIREILERGNAVRFAPVASSAAQEDLSNIKKQLTQLDRRWHEA